MRRLTVIHMWSRDGLEIRPCAHNLKLCLFAKKNCQQVLRSKVENSNFAYVKLSLFHKHSRFPKTNRSDPSQLQTNSR